MGEAPFDGITAETLPVVVGNSGSPGAPRRSPNQALRTALVVGTSGVRRSFRPLPTVCTLAPAVSVMSSRERAASSEIRRPVWMVRANMAWSRRPVQVVWSQASNSAATSGSVR